MKYFKNTALTVILYITNFIIAQPTTPERSSHLRPTQAESFRNKLIEEYSNQAKNNDRFTNDFIMSVNQSNLSPGYRKDVFEKAIHYYDLLQNVVQTNLDKLNNANNAIEINTQLLQPQIQPTIQDQSTQTFQNLIDYIKNTKTADAWDNNNKRLNPNFVADLVKKTKNNNLNDEQLNILLTIARDHHAQFTGDQKSDIAILETLKKQKNAAKMNLKLSE